MYKTFMLWHYRRVVATSIPDTYRLIGQLKSRGFSESQAEGIADALNAQDLDHLVTKADLQELENRILKWMIPLMLGQAAVFALIVKWFVG